MAGRWPIRGAAAAIPQSLQPERQVPATQEASQPFEAAQDAAPAPWDGGGEGNQVRVMLPDAAWSSGSCEG